MEVVPKEVQQGLGCLLLGVVSAGRLELPTGRLVIGCSVLLNYAPPTPTATPGSANFRALQFSASY